MEDYFEARNAGRTLINALPAPEGFDGWRHGRLFNEEVLYTAANGRFFILADTDIFGFSLHCYTYDPDGQVFRVAYDFAARPITKHKGDIITMSANVTNLDSLRLPTMGNMPQQPVYPAAPMAPVTGEGISSGSVDIRAIQSSARIHAYVAGYVVMNAPKVECVSHKVSLGDNKFKEELYFRETKPSGVRAVLMSLPKRCVLKGNNLATPADIKKGNVDYNSYGNEMLHIAMSKDTAAAYIGALGGRIPEYAPTSDAKQWTQQWSESDLRSDAPHVGFVYVRASQSATKGVRFDLKSSSARRSIFSQDNVCCLNAVEHMPVKKKLTEKEAKELNDSAFYYKNYNVSNEKNSLDEFLKKFPNQVWKTQYEVKGENGAVDKVEGCVSTFFFSGNVLEHNGVEIPHSDDLGYKRWFHTGSMRNEPAVSLDRLVKRTLQDTKAKKGAESKKVMRPTTITLQSVMEGGNTGKQGEEFQPYAKFVEFITGSRGGVQYLTTAQLFALSRRSKNTDPAKSMKLSKQDEAALERFWETAEMQASLSALQEAASVMLAD